ncbi:hypothetical protein PG987_005137 [Apiospora arundinis]
MMHQPLNPTAPRIQVASMPQLAEAKSREDDWTGTKDAAARRRAQTRLNTRAYRKRKALAKKIEASADEAGTLDKSERVVECWNMETQTVGRLFPSMPGPPNHPPTIQRPPCSGCQSHPGLGYLGDAFRLRRGSDPGTLVPYGPKKTTSSTPTHGSAADGAARQLDRHFPSPEARDALIRAVGSGAMDEDELWADCIGGLYEGVPDDEVERRGVVAWSPPWGPRRVGDVGGIPAQVGVVVWHGAGGFGGDEPVAEGARGGSV